MLCNTPLWPIKFVETAWHISARNRNSIATECPASLIISLLLLILRTRIKPEVLPLANTSVTQSVSNMEKDQSGLKAQAPGSK